MGSEQETEDLKNKQVKESGKQIITRQVYIYIKESDIPGEALQGHTKDKYKAILQQNELKILHKAIIQNKTRQRVNIRSLKLQK